LIDLIDLIDSLAFFTRHVENGGMVNLFPSILLVVSFLGAVAYFMSGVLGLLFYLNASGPKEKLVSRRLCFGGFLLSFFVGLCIVCYCSSFPCFFGLFGPIGYLVLAVGLVFWPLGCWLYRYIASCFVSW
jgi:hypothetical protein